MAATIEDCRNPKQELTWLEKRLEKVTYEQDVWHYKVIEGCEAEFTVELIGHKLTAQEVGVLEAQMLKTRELS